MPTHTWDLAVVELVYYIPSAIPTLNCTWVYRKTALVGWLFMFAFVLLQIIGSGMIVGAGENGIPSSTATILISVGLSPLIVGIAGIVHGWERAKHIFKSEKLSMIISIIFHIVVLAAIALYATGLSNVHKPGDHRGAQTMAEAGVLLLLFSAFSMIGITIVLVMKAGVRPLRPLLAAIGFSFALLLIRLLYQTVAVFKDDEPKYNPETGSIALRVVFEFVPGALILLALVTGGVMCSQMSEEMHQGVYTDVPMGSRESSESR